MKSALHFLVAGDFAAFDKTQDRDGRFGKLIKLKGGGR